MNVNEFDIRKTGLLFFDMLNVYYHGATPKERASVFSLNALPFRVASVVVLPPIGFFADLLGLEPVLGLLGVLSIVAALTACSLSPAHTRLR